MATKDNYLTLTEEQKQYVRENSTKMSVGTIIANLRTSRHEVMRFILAEKLSMKVNKNYNRKPKEEDFNIPTF